MSIKNEYIGIKEMKTIINNYDKIMSTHQSFLNEIE